MSISSTEYLLATSLTLNWGTDGLGGFCAFTDSTVKTIKLDSNKTTNVNAQTLLTEFILNTW